MQKSRLPSLPMENLANHPAVKLGQWLKAARQQRGIVKRLFAGEIGLTASKYSELEAGVTCWLTQRQESAIPVVLELSGDQLTEFKSLLTDARSRPELKFNMLFTREQLEPVRYRHNDRSEQPSEIDKDAILAAVFAPIP